MWALFGVCSGLVRKIGTESVSNNNNADRCRPWLCSLKKKAFVYTPQTTRIREEIDKEGDLCCFGNQSAGGEQIKVVCDSSAKTSHTSTCMCPQLPTSLEALFVKNMMTAHSFVPTRHAFRASQCHKNRLSHRASSKLVHRGEIGICLPDKRCIPKGFNHRQT